MNFREFASAHGLIVDQVIPDGRWKRVPTTDHPRKKNGAYLTDGRFGAVINWATMLEHAVYRPDGAVEQISEEDRRRLAKLAQDNARAKLQAERQATKLAADILSRSHLLTPQDARFWKREPAITAHPYLRSKGLFRQSCLTIDEDYKEAPARSLLVPMHDCQSGDLIGMQMIQEDGTKRFLAGQRAKGAVHVIGREREKWLVEGFATGLSVREALKGLYRTACVVVCFSAGNLAYVASQGIGTHVFADHDKNKAGEESALKTGLPWCMSDSIGDANDLHQHQGLDAVKAVMRRIL